MPTGESKPLVAWEFARAAINVKPAFDAVRRPDELQKIALIRPHASAGASGDDEQVPTAGLVTWYLREIQALLGRAGPSNPQAQFTPAIVLVQAAARMRQARFGGALALEVAHRQAERFARR